MAWRAAIFILAAVARAATGPAYVGEAACAKCHAAIHGQ